MSPQRRPTVRSAATMAAAIVLLGAGVGCTEDTSTVSPSAAGPTSSAGAAAPAAPAVDPDELTFRVIDRHPHDTAAFTEGLTFTGDGRLMESLGLEGESSVREVDPATGEVLLESLLPADQFGEGLALGPDGLVQLTWKNGVATRWDPATLTADDTFAFDGEGWGLTFDGEQFVQSDGSPVLTRRDSATFEPAGTVTVRRSGEPVEEINELEWVDGVIWANVWHSDDILRIDPTTGTVTGVIDASNLWQDAARGPEMTLNGIAHRPGDPVNRLWVTGKNWPEIFEIEVTGP